MIIPLALLALAAPTDTPIEPITESLMTLGIESGVMDESCTSYGVVIPLLAVALDGDTALAMDITDGYFIVTFETGYGGRLTDEAREAVTSFLHGCV